MYATNENDFHPENLCHMRILTVLSLYLKHICSEDYPPLMHVAEFRAKLSRKGTKISSSPGVSMNLAQLRLGLSEREPRVHIASERSGRDTNLPLSRTHHAIFSCPRCELPQLAAPFFFAELTIKLASTRSRAHRSKI